MKNKKLVAKRLIQIRNLKEKNSYLFTELGIFKLENKHLKGIIESYKELIKVLKEKENA